jgi:menaquinone-specific isochorismate synthase
VKVRKRTFLPDRSGWTIAVQSALAKGIEKVVLARCQVLELESAPDPFALTASLKEKAKGAFIFCFSDGDTAFLGASPERLFCRVGQMLYSEAMAGTRPRGHSLEEDIKFETELLGSAKDLREFIPVRAFLEKTLTPLCQEALSFSPIGLYKTQNVQHLYTRCTARLKPNCSDDDILRRLHPTPALCGTPQSDAFKTIRELEPFDRGLYGGALGWSCGNASEWIVGIRCCLIQKQRAYLYTGTGIVEGSDPAKEWEELDHKARLYEGIFI